VAGLLLVIPSLAFAAVTVKGKVTGQQKLLNSSWNEAKDRKANRFTFREPSATVNAAVRELTAFLPKELAIAAVGTAAPAAKPQPQIVSVSGGRTSPVTIVVAQGQVVQFTNKDPFTHKLYEVGGKLAAEELAPSKSRSWTPPAVGKYELRDQATPSLRSWVVVLPHLAKVTYPTKAGDFELELDPGTYKLRGYFEGNAVGQELEAVVGTVELPLKAPLVVGDVPQDAGTGG
jgi:hypothetical protein